MPAMTTGSPEIAAYFARVYTLRPTIPDVCVPGSPSIFWSPLG